MGQVKLTTGNVGKPQRPQARDPKILKNVGEYLAEEGLMKQKQGYIGCGSTTWVNSGSLKLNSEGETDGAWIPVALKCWIEGELNLASITLGVHNAYVILNELERRGVFRDYIEVPKLYHSIVEDNEGKLIILPTDKVIIPNNMIFPVVKNIVLVVDDLSYGMENEIEDVRDERQIPKENRKEVLRILDILNRLIMSNKKNKQITEMVKSILGTLFIVHNNNGRNWDRRVYIGDLDQSGINFLEIIGLQKVPIESIVN